MGVPISLIEAIEWQKAFKRRYKAIHAVIHDVESACDMAISALEKQIPKKVVRVKLRPSEWRSGVYCPACESEQTHTEFFTADGTEPDEKTTWCSECGQKLDWSE